MDRGVRAMTSPVAGLCTSRRSVASRGNPAPADEVGQDLQAAAPSRRRAPGPGFYSSQSGQPRKGMRSQGVGCASPEIPAQAPAVRVPEIALQLIRVVGVLREDPAEEDVGPALARVLQQALTQVHVVASDAFGHLAVGADGLQKIHSRTGGRHVSGPRWIRSGGWPAGRGRERGSPGKRGSCAGFGGAGSKRVLPASLIGTLV